MQLFERVSTFKDAQEPEKPSKKTEKVYVNAEKEPKEDSKQKAPLGEGEDTDDELGNHKHFKGIMVKILP